MNLAFLHIDKKKHTHTTGGSEGGKKEYIKEKF